MASENINEETTAQSTEETETTVETTPSKDKSDETPVPKEDEQCKESDAKTIEVENPTETNLNIEEDNVSRVSSVQGDCSHSVQYRSSCSRVQVFHRV